MYFKVILFILGYWCCSFPISKAQLPEPVYRQLSVDDGLPSSEVYDIFQDDKGYLWFATDRGVCRYDGYEIKTYTTADGLIDNTVFEITPDAKGRLWFKTFSGRLSYYENDSFHSLPINDTLLHIMSSRFMSSMYVDAQDTIWMGFTGKRGGMCKATFDSVIMMEPPAIPMDSRYFIKQVDTNGFICGSPDGKQGNLSFLKIQLHHREFRVPIKPGVFYGKHISVIPLPDAGFLFYHDKDLILFRGDSILNEKSFENKIIAMSQDKGYHTWIGMYQNGAIRNPLQANPQHFLPGRSVTDILEDTEGNIWFSTLEEGIYFLPSINFKSYSTQTGLTHPFINKVVADEKGKIWLGLNNGDLNIITGSQVKTIEYPGWPIGFVSVLEPIDHDKMWVCIGYDNFQIDQQLNVKKIRFQKEYKHFNIKALYPENDSVFWAGTATSLNKIVKDRIVYDGGAHGWENWLSVIYPAGPGQLLIGTLNGLWRHHQGKYEYLGDRWPLLKNRITDLVGIGSQFWIASSGGGMLILDGDSLRQLTISDGLISTTCNALFFDPDSMLWVGTNHGLSIIPVNTDQEKPAIKNLTIRDGLISNEVNDIAVVGDSVWVGTKKGLTVFNKRLLKHQNNYQPPLLLTGLFINGSAHPVTDRLNLPYNRNYLLIKYKGLSYKNAGKLTYQYKMNGIDSTWKYTTNTSVQYPNLAPGDYTFHIAVAQDYLPEPVSPVGLNFVIQPPFWQTWWFRTFYITTILAIIYLFFRIRVLTYNRDVVRELIQTLIQKIKKEKYLFVKTVLDGSYVKIPLYKILWIEADRDYIEIVTQQQKVVIRSTLKKMDQELSGSNNFIRIHRSFIINMNYMTSVQAKSVRLNEHLIPVGKSYLKTLNHLKEVLQERSV